MRFSASIPSRVIVSIVLVLACVTLSPRSGAGVSFVREVAPVLATRCMGCHSERIGLGGYRLHTYQSLMKPGASGKPAIVPSRPADSRLFQLITASTAAARMPQGDAPLTTAQVETLRRWIAEGARFDGADRAASLRTLGGPRVHPAAPAVYRSAVPVLALAFAPDRDELAVGGYNEVTIWNATTGALLRRLPRLPQRIQSLAYGVGGRLLLVAGGTPGEYGEATLIDLVHGDRRVLDTADDVFLCASFSPDGHRVIAGGADAGVRAYDVASGRRLWASRLHSDWVTAVGISADGKYVASASRDMTVKVYEADSGALYTTYTGHNRQIGTYAGQSAIYALRFSPDRLLAATAGGGRWIQLWDPVHARAEAGDAGDMEERFAKQGHARYIDHGFERDIYALAMRSGRVFAASADGHVGQYTLETRQPVRTYDAAGEWLFALDVDPAGRRVAAGSYDGRVHVWDATSGREICVFAARPGTVTSVVGRH